MLPKRWYPQFNPPDVPWQQNVLYGIHAETKERLLADIWQPPVGVDPTGLGIIYVHGSGWHYLDKDMGNRLFFRHLAAQGHVILDIAYTKPPNSQLEGMVADVNRAIAWMKTDGICLGVLPERIVLMGCSSGAHLALLAAYAPNHPAFKPPEIDMDTSVRGVVSFSGQTDLLAMYKYFERHFPPFLMGRIPLERWMQSAIEWFFHHSRVRKEGSYVDPLQLLPSVLGGTPDEVPEQYYLGSPINHVGPHCPPTLIFQGSHDYTGLLPEVRRMHTALRNAGVTSIYVEFPNSEHAFEFGLSLWSPPAQAATYDTERFLALLT
jgi:acetyl esterase/lipase